LEFQTATQRRFARTGRFLLGFAAILLVLGTFSFAALYRSGMLDQWFGEPTGPTEATTQEEKSGVWRHTGTATFLLAVTDNDRQDLRLLLLLRADLAERSLRVTALDPGAQAEAGNERGTLRQHLSRGGLKQLTAAAAAAAGIPVDRYVGSREDDFVKAVNLIGSVTVELDKAVRYRSPAFSITLAEGRQRLQGDMLLRYFRYLDTQGAAGRRRQGELFCRMLDSYLMPANADKAEERFDALINLVQTNISVLDFDGNLAALQDLMRSGDRPAAQYAEILSSSEQFDF
jgi:hypothetical protein